MSPAWRPVVFTSTRNSEYGRPRAPARPWRIEVVRRWRVYRWVWNGDERLTSGVRIQIWRRSDVGVLIAERGALISSTLSWRRGTPTWLDHATGWLAPSTGIDELPWRVLMKPAIALARCVHFRPRRLRDRAGHPPAPGRRSGILPDRRAGCAVPEREHHGRFRSRPSRQRPGRFRSTRSIIGCCRLQSDVPTGSARSLWHAFR